MYDLPRKLFENNSEKWNDNCFIGMSIEYTVKKIRGTPELPTEVTDAYVIR